MDKILIGIDRSEVDYITIVTNAEGPIGEDLFFVIVTQEKVVTVPSAMSKDFFDWVEEFPGVDYELSIRASGCTTEGSFVLWRREGLPTYNSDIRNRMFDRLKNLYIDKFSFDPVEADRKTQYLFSQYESSSREYHDLRHIHHCLYELDSLSDATLNRVSIELAIWYHDLVYSPGSKKNEIESSKVLQNDFNGTKKIEVVQEASQMILMSANHTKVDLCSPSAATFLDIDLSILGQNEVDYGSYYRSVRRELKTIPTFLYKFARKRFLKKLLLQNIFKTPYFHSRYETKARENILIELDGLRFLSM